MVVTGWSGTAFALGGPATTQDCGVNFIPFAHPAPIRGPATLIPWTGSRFSPLKFYWAMTRVWLGWGLGRGQGRAKRKNKPCPRPVGGPERGISPRYSCFIAPLGPRNYCSLRCRVRQDLPSEAPPLHKDGGRICAFSPLHSRPEPNPTDSLDWLLFPTTKSLGGLYRARVGYGPRPGIQA